MAGIQNDEIFQPPGYAPVPIRVHLALIAGVEPAVAQHLPRFSLPVPVAPENIRTTHDDFVVFTEFHLDAGNGRANASGLNMGWVVQSADARGFGEAVPLQHGNVEHHEK